MPAAAMNAAAMTASELAAIAEEVSALAAGARIRRVHERVPAGVALELRAPGATHWLVVVAEPPVTRMHLAGERPARPEEAGELVRQLRHALEGARLEAVEVTPGDRIVRLRTGRGALVAELTGRHGNLLLVDESETIRAVARPGRAGPRKLLPGAPYQAPAGRGEGHEQAPTRKSDGPDLAALPPDGARSRAAAAHFDALERAGLVESARSDLARALRRADKALARRVETLEADLEAALGADRDRRLAEGLVALGQPRRRGLAEVDVVDYGDPATPSVAVELDPALTIQGNAERLFKRHRKLTRSRHTIEARLAAAREAAVAVRRARERLAALGTVDEIDALAEELVAAGHVSERAVRRRAAEGGPARRPAGARRRREEPARALPYRTYRSLRGREILVGRSATDNDTLSLRVARGADLWLHAEGSSGSHVVVRLERGEEPDRDTLLDAATLAAHFSSGAKAGKVGVIYTRAANVRKPKGSKPGLVTAVRTRSLTLRMDERRVERLLGRDPAARAL